MKYMEEFLILVGIAILIIAIAFAAHMHGLNKKQDYDNCRAVRMTLEDCRKIMDKK
jgi:nitrogen fixation-related uncharacterized protein